LGPINIPTLALADLNLHEHIMCYGLMSAKFAMIFVSLCFRSLKELHAKNYRDVANQALC